MFKVPYLREVAEFAEPMTFCSGGCECDITANNVWNSDSSYVVIGGMAFWALEGEPDNAWDNPMCKECSHHPRNLDYEVWED